MMRKLSLCPLIVFTQVLPSMLISGITIISSVVQVVSALWFVPYTTSPFSSR